MPTIVHIDLSERDTTPNYLACPVMHLCESRGNRDVCHDCTDVNHWYGCATRAGLPSAEHNCTTCYYHDECTRRRFHLREHADESESSIICGEYLRKSCVFCGEQIGAIIEIRGYRNRVPICSHCRTTHTCTRCHRMYWNELNLVVGIGRVCDACAVIACNYCGGRVDLRKLENERDVWNLSHYGVCADCFENLTPCARCGTLVNSDNTQTVLGRGPLCWDCAEYLTDRFTCSVCGVMEENHHCIYRVESYGTELQLHFYHLESEKNPLHFGIELETVPESGRRAAVRKLSECPIKVTDYMIPTDDGSLEDGGIEWMMQPMSTAYLHQFFGENAQYFTGFEIRNCCGSHHNVSRDVLTFNQWVKLSIIWYSDDFQTTFLHAIGRGFNLWCNKKFDKDARVVNSSYHYDAINYDNDGRVEFRQFKLHRIDAESFAYTTILLETLIDVIKHTRRTMAWIDANMESFVAHIRAVYTKNLAKYGYTLETLESSYNRRDWTR